MIPEAILVISNYIGNMLDYIEALRKDEATVLSWRTKKPIKVGEPFYESQKDSEIRHAQSDIHFAEKDKARLQARYDAWKKEATK